MKSTLAQQIVACDTLPVLPAIAIKIIELHNDDDLYAAKVAGVISQDPALSAKLLQITNSSFFPFRREVTNITQAIAILGVNLAMSVALSSALIKMLRDSESKKHAFDHERYWRKSILGALVASELGDNIAGLNRGDIYVAALMQDIGILVLSEVLGGEYSAMYNTARNHYDLVLLEQRNWGMDHAEAGALLLKKWRLPKYIVDVVERSHCLLFDAQQLDFKQTDLVYASSLAGVVSEQWLSDVPEEEYVSDILLGALAHLGEDNYAEVVSRVISAIPSAEAVFSIDLLSNVQIDKIA
jgi:HD-like signal output (HDOD) protein